MTKTPKKLKVEKANGSTGNIVVTLSEDDGQTYQLSLSVFDVSTLVSMLYAARATALNKEPEKGPEVMLPINGIAFGSDEAGRQLLRIYVSEKVYQDFCADAGTEISEAMRIFSKASAKVFRQDHVEWKGPGRKH